MGHNPLKYTDPSGHCFGTRAPCGSYITDYWNQVKQTAADDWDAVKGWASAAVDFIPGYGSAKAVFDIVSGQDSITGEDLTGIQRGVAALGLIPAGKLIVSASEGLVKVGGKVYKFFKSSIGEVRLEVKEEIKDLSETGERIYNVNKQESQIWRSFDNLKGMDRKTSGSGRDKRFYEWDFTHNDIEVYDRKGNHLGSMDPASGEIYKGPVQGRTIDID